VGLYYKCKLCCKTLNIFKMFNGSLGHVPGVERPQKYFFDSCIASRRWLCMNLLQELVSCKDDFTQNCSSMVNGRRKVYNTVTGRTDIWKYFSVVDTRQYPLNITLLNGPWYQIHLPILQYQNFTTLFLFKLFLHNSTRLYEPKWQLHDDATNLTFYHKQLTISPS